MKPGGFLVVHLLTRKWWGFPGGFLVVYLLTRKQWGFPKTTIGNFRFSLLKKPGGFLKVELNSIETYALQFFGHNGWTVKVVAPGGFLGVSTATATLMVHPLIIYFKVVCWQYMSSASHFIPENKNSVIYFTWTTMKCVFYSFTGKFWAYNFHEQWTTRNLQKIISM